MKRSLIAALVFVLGMAGSAEAHLSPRTLGVVLYDDQRRATMLLTTYGLVLREGDAWRYVCPVRHGGPDAPPAVATGGDRAWIVTIDGAQLVGADLTPLTDKFDDVTVVALPELAATSAGAFALVLEGKGSALYRLRPEGAERVFSDRDPWQDVAPIDDGLLLARTTTSSVIEFTQLDLAGTVTSTYAVPRLAWEISLFNAPDALFAVATDARSSVVMERVGSAMEIVLETPGIIHSVTRDGGRTLASIDGVLNAVEGGVATPTGVSEQITCFGHGPGGAYACSNLQLYALEGDGRLGEPLFLMPWIEAPRREGLSADDSATCDFQWRDLQSETGLLPANPPDDPPPEPGGCTTTGRPSFGAALVLMLWGAWIRSASSRRRRSRRVCRCVSSRRPSA